MGRVWRATDVVLHREVAIKELVPPPGLTAGERQEMRERSLREARAIARLNNINVVRVFDVLRTDADPWIVMEYVPSRSLQDTLAADGPFTPVRAAEIGLGVLGALRAAHRAGVVHRDVKPGNVLMGEDGRVVLTDFGLATVPGDPNVTRTGLVLGSPAYIAPERARDGTAGPAADLWSLGATLYAAVEGASPFARPSAIATLTALATESPPPARNAGPLKPVLNGLLRKDPTHRINAEEAERLLLRASGRRSKLTFPMSSTMRRPGVGRERPALPGSMVSPAASAPVVPGPRPPVVPARPASPPGQPPVVPGGRPAVGEGRPPVFVPGKAPVGRPAAETPTRVDGPKVDAPRLDATRVDAPPVRDDKTTKFGTAPASPAAAGPSTARGPVRPAADEAPRPAGTGRADVAARRGKRTTPDPVADATTVVGPSPVVRQGSAPASAPPVVPGATPATPATASAGAAVAPAQTGGTTTPAKPEKTTPAQTGGTTTPAQTGGTATTNKTGGAKTGGKPDSAAARSGAAKSKAAGSGTAPTEAAQPVAAQPDSATAEPAQGEAVKSGSKTAQPAKAKTTSAKPAAAQSSPTESEAAQADAAQLESASPETVPADAPRSEPASPKAEQPDAAQSAGPKAAESEAAQSGPADVETGAMKAEPESDATAAEPDPAAAKSDVAEAEAGAATPAAADSAAADSTAPASAESKEDADTLKTTLLKTTRPKATGQRKAAAKPTPAPADAAAAPDPEKDDAAKAATAEDDKTSLLSRPLLPLAHPVESDRIDDLAPVSPVPAISRPSRPAWSPMEVRPAGPGVTVFGTRLTYRQAAIGVGILLLVLILAITLIVQSVGDTDGKPTGTQPTAATSGAGSPSSTAPSKAAPSSPPPSSAAAATLPAGWELRQIKAGNGVPAYTVPVPKDAEQESADQGQIYFKWNNRLLLVGRTASPASDAFEDWVRQEKQRRGEYSGYQKVRIDRVKSWRGFRSVADWEYYYTTNGGNRQHVIRRNFVVSDQAAYSLNWYASPDDWAASQSDLNVIYQGFQPG